MSRRVAGWLITTATLVLALDGLLVWLWVRVGGWGFLLLVGVGVAVTAAYALRLGILMRRTVSVESIALVVLAPVLPRREALTWLAELGGQLHEVAGDRARWRAIRMDAVRSMPGLLHAAWGGWMRDGVVTVAVRYARPRITAIDQVMRSPLRPWPADGQGLVRLRRRLRTLSRCSQVLVWSAGSHQQSDMIRQARALVELCALAQLEITRTPYTYQPPACTAALVLEIQHLTKMLAEGLAEHRRAYGGGAEPSGPAAPSP